MNTARFGFYVLSLPAGPGQGTQPARPCSFLKVPFRGQEAGSDVKGGALPAGVQRAEKAMTRGCPNPL